MNRFNNQFAFMAYLLAAALVIITCFAIGGFASSNDAIALPSHHVVELPHNNEYKAPPYCIKITPPIWATTEVSLRTLYSSSVHLTNNSQLREDILIFLTQYAEQHDFILTKRDQPKSFHRFKEKVAEALSKYSKKMRDNVDGYSDDTKKQWLTFARVFNDLAAARLAPKNGKVIDDFKTTTEIAEALVPYLKSKGHEKDESWTTVVKSSANGKTRLFINLTPEVQDLFHIRLSMEIQILQSADVAIAFKANSVSGHHHNNEKPPFESPFSVLRDSNRAETECELRDLGTLMLNGQFTQAAHHQHFSEMRGFYASEDFWHFFYKMKRHYN